MTKKKGKSKVTLAGKVLRLVNTLLLLLLLATYLVPYVHPARLPYFTTLALAYPLLLVLNVLFVILWLIRGRWFFLLSLAVVLLGINHISTHVRFFHPGKVPDDSGQGLRVVSYNTHLFGFYDWKNNRQTCDNIFSLLESTRADVYCFQEFFDNPKQFPVLDTLSRLLKTPYVYFDQYLTLNKLNHFGMAVMSRFPILDSGRIINREPHANYTIYADILFLGDTVRIYNNHLESIRFSKDDYYFYEELTRNPSEQKDIKKKSQSLVRKLVRAYRERAEEADLLAKDLSGTRHPVIVCGDFNDTPLSYTYRKVARGLEDAFVESGFGLGNTYAGLFPSYRIDYILYDPAFESTEYKTYRKAYSDHYPIAATLIVRR